MPDFPPHPEACQGCPANSWGVGFVPPTGPLDADLMAIGQGPGEAEATFSQPFFPKAPAGSMLTDWLHKATIPRGSVRIHNTVWCWLPSLAPERRRGVPTNKWGNRDPKRAEAQACWERHSGPETHRAIAANPELHIVTLGAPATKWLLGIPWTKGAERYVGTTQRVEVPSVQRP